MMEFQNLKWQKNQGEVTKTPNQNKNKTQNWERMKRGKIMPTLYFSVFLSEEMGLWSLGTKIIESIKCTESKIGEKIEMF